MSGFGDLHARLLIRVPIFRWPKSQKRRVEVRGDRHLRFEAPGRNHENGPQMAV